MIHILSLIMIAILSVGCTTKEPPMKEYRIDVRMPSNDTSENSRCKAETLTFLPLQSGNLFRSSTMSYARGAYELGKFTQSQWALPPVQEIKKEILSMLIESDLFTFVQAAPSRAKSSWVLEGELEDFMQYFDADAKNSFAHLKIRLTLIDTNTSTVVASKVFSQKIASQHNDASGGVAALNKALEMQLAEIQQWFVKVCR